MFEFLTALVQTAAKADVIWNAIQADVIWNALRALIG